MIHTFRPTDAFVDESLRGQRYLMGCVLLEARSLASVRAEISSLRLGGGRIHFNNESTRQRRRVLAAIAAMPISATVDVCNRGQGTTAFTARSLCLEQIVQHLQAHEVARLVLESRGYDGEDIRTLGRVRAPHPPLIFEHRIGATEPLLWIADGITWAVGAGGTWRSFVMPIVEEIVQLRP